MYQSAFGQNRQSSGVITSQRTNIINTSERFGSLAHLSDDSSTLSRLRTDDRVQNLLNQAKNPNSMKLTFMDDGKKDDESYLDSSESGSFYDRNGSVSYVPAPNDNIAHDYAAAVINTRDTDQYNHGEGLKDSGKIGQGNMQNLYKLKNLLQNEF